MTALRLVRDDDNSDEILARWATWMRAQSWSPRTIAERPTIVVRVALQADRAPHQLTTDDVLDFLGGSFSAATRKKYHVDLLSWFRWLVQTGVRADNPMDGLKTPRAHRKPIRTISTEQLTALLNCGVRSRTRSMILLAAYQGLRVHEIAKFRGSDIDLNKGVLYVVGKGDLHAELPLHPRIALEAEKYGQGWWFPQWKPNKRGESGGPIMGSAVTNLIGGAMQRTGIPGSAHSLRHWYATELLRAGVDLRVLQQLMRHASIATTERYLHVDDSQRRDGLLLLPDVPLWGPAGGASE